MRQPLRHFRSSQLRAFRHRRAPPCQAMSCPYRTQTSGVCENARNAIVAYFFSSEPGCRRSLIATYMAGEEGGNETARLASNGSNAVK